jgi:uncharacterized Zn-finger protein
MAAEHTAAGWSVNAPRNAEVQLPEVHQDPETRAVYVRLTPLMGASVARTTTVHPRVNLDFGDRGELLGVEVL